MTQLLAAAEVGVGPKLAAELTAHFRLADLVTDLAGEAIEEIENSPGEPRAIHACAILLSRLITDMRAIAHLVRLGYVAPALGLTAGMLEMAYTSMYIGADEARAERWLTHDDTKNSAPWGVYDMVHAVTNRVGLVEAAARREWDTIYRQACMAKHGNPLALADVGVLEQADWRFVLTGPYLDTAVRRWAHVSVSMAVRYTKLAGITFCRDHVLAGERQQHYFRRWVHVTELQREMEAADVEEFRIATPPVDAPPVE